MTTIGVTEAARRLEVSKKTIRWYINDGKIKAEKRNPNFINSPYEIDEKEINRLIAERHQDRIEEKARFYTLLRGWKEFQHPEIKRIITFLVGLHPEEINDPEAWTMQAAGILGPSEFAEFVENMEVDILGPSAGTFKALAMKYHEVKIDGIAQFLPKDEDYD